MVADGKFRLLLTPRENYTRPAIDPLFRSAAAYYSNRAIGVLLSGLLDDGTDGLRAIKRCGGSTVVQDPDEALFPDMPRNAILRGHVDHISPLAMIPRLLHELASQPVGAGQKVPDDLLREVRFLEQGPVSFNYPEPEWQQAPLACPECGGPLWQRSEEAEGFGCSVGHRFGAMGLIAAQDASIEQSLWAAVRMFQERSKVLRRLVESEMTKTDQQAAELYRKREAESRTHAERLKEFLQKVSKPEITPV